MSAVGGDGGVGDGEAAGASVSSVSMRSESVPFCELERGEVRAR